MARRSESPSFQADKSNGVDSSQSLGTQASLVEAIRNEIGNSDIAPWISARKLLSGEEEVAAKMIEGEDVELWPLFETVLPLYLSHLIAQGSTSVSEEEKEGVLYNWLNTQLISLVKGRLVHGLIIKNKVPQKGDSLLQLLLRHAEQFQNYFLRFVKELVLHEAAFFTFNKLSSLPLSSKFHLKKEFGLGRISSDGYLLLRNAVLYYLHQRALMAKKLKTNPF